MDRKKMMCSVIIFIQIETHKIEFREKAAPKVGSTKNVKHQPGGGDKKVCIMFI